MILIPAIDLKDQKCVRLRQGDMNQTTVFSEDPVATATHWHKQGAERLHLVDLNGAFAGEPVNQQIIADIAKKHPDFILQVGGGIRTLDTIATYINQGVNYVILGTVAVKNPDFVRQACAEFPGHVIIGIDAKNGYVATEGWAEVSSLSAIDLASDMANFGVEAIIYTDINRDGMMQGVNLEATQQLAEAIPLPIIASGGITNMKDIQDLANLPKPAKQPGITGAISGRAIYEGQLDFSEAHAWLNEQIPETSL